MEEIIKVTDENGKEKEYSVLATFEYKNRKFVVYTAYEIDDNNKAKVYSAIYKTDGESIKLKKIKEPDDINVTQNFINDLEKMIINKTEE